MIVGFDAKRIVQNATGLGSYGRTLVHDLIRRNDPGMQYLLYAPDKGRDVLSNQINIGDTAQFRYPSFNSSILPFLLHEFVERLLQLLQHTVEPAPVLKRGALYHLLKADGFLPVHRHQVHL